MNKEKSEKVSIDELIGIIPKKVFSRKIKNTSKKKDKMTLSDIYWNYHLDDLKIPYLEIDAEMRGLIWLLNKIPDIKTHFCCFGHGDGTAYIMLEMNNWELQNINHFFSTILVINNNIAFSPWSAKLDLYNSTNTSNRFIMESNTTSLDETLQEIITIENNLIRYMYIELDINVKEIYDVYLDHSFFLPDNCNIKGRIEEIAEIYK